MFDYRAMLETANMLSDTSICPFPFVAQSCLSYIYSSTSCRLIEEAISAESLSCCHLTLETPEMGFVYAAVVLSALPRRPTPSHPILQGAFSPSSKTAFTLSENWKRLPYRKGREALQRLKLPLCSLQV